MRGIKVRFLFWLLGWIALFLLANLKLRVFPHVLLLFWTLLPILSLLVSLLSRKQLHLSLELSPSSCLEGEEGKWICHLTNESRVMAFFLRFPEMRKTTKRFHPPVEIMLKPGESRELILSYQYPYPGKYSFNQKEPVFEDFLGFFYLKFSHIYRQATPQGWSLPKKAGDMPGRLSEKLESLAYEQNLHRKNEVTDEIFSIDPIHPGESLAHAHWKLSARMQKWMIKRYSEQEKQPFRFIIDLLALSQAPEPIFHGIYYKEPSAEEKKWLGLRSDLLRLVWTIGEDLLRKGESIEIGTRNSVIFRFQGAEDRLGFQKWLADLPFVEEKSDWFLQPLGQRQQLIFVDRLSEENVGSLLQNQELGVSFLLVSFKKAAKQSLVDTLEKSPIECIWLDEE